MCMNYMQNTSKDIKKRVSFQLQFNSFLLALHIWMARLGEGILDCQARSKANLFILLWLRRVANLMEYRSITYK